MPEKILSHKNNFAQYFYVLIVFFAITLLAGQFYITRQHFEQLLIWQILLHCIFVFFYFKKEYISIWAMTNRGLPLIHL